MQAPRPAGVDCLPVGSWVIPETRESLATAGLLDRIAEKRVVLLGESHDRADHHAWQLDTIAALHGRRGPLVLAFEMFPRSSQPALDRWVAGEIDEREFFAASNWSTVWRFPVDLYAPLFRFARRNRLPMLALNVDRALVSRVANHGWETVPEAEREGVSTPAPPVPEYERFLEEVYEAHLDEDEDADPAALRGFISAQLAWDRAFAEPIHRALQERPGATVVGIIGSGHLEHGYGVSHQLAALGTDDVAVLLPWDRERSCDEMTPDVADAVFGLEAPTQAAARPMLGVGIGSAEGGGVVILQIAENSVGAAAGLVEGDVVVEAAGSPIATPADLKGIVGRQSPGTWLPMKVRRGAKTIELVAKFPNES
jgi:uncharacterized iron-regulated protein